MTARSGGSKSKILHDRMIYWLPEVDSTNTYLKRVMPDAPHGTVVAAHTQTAGRGQRGNHWEAEPGMNLTFSVMLRPKGVSGRRQYAISEAVAVAITDTLRGYVPDRRLLTVKWPNDIYYGDRKLCGILIENSLTGTEIERSVVGAGVNVNQTVFRSEAPNPVSLKQITGQDYDIKKLLEDIADAIAEEFDAPERDLDDLHGRYLGNLWRREGFYPYKTPDGDEFEAMIADVAPTGCLTLRRRDGSQSTYAFKEVIAIIK